MFILLGDPDDADDKGVCIYLDGMNAALHGDPATAARDREIRGWLRNNGFHVIEITYVELDDRNAMVRHFKKLARFLEGKDLAKRIEEDSSWFDGTKPVPLVTARTLPFRQVDPTPGERYRTCVPLIPLQAAAGGFGEAAGDLPADAAWVRIQSKHRLREGMFVARVTGKSMEPRIPDGAHCLFHGPVEGSRDGKVVLVRLRDLVDPETGERFTLKRYRSAKQQTDDGSWRHETITLCPVNPDFQPIVLASDDDGRIDVVAELIEVLG